MTNDSHSGGNYLAVLLVNLFTDINNVTVTSKAKHHSVRSLEISLSSLVFVSGLPRNSGFFIVIIYTEESTKQTGSRREGESLGKRERKKCFEIKKVETKIGSVKFN